MVSKFIFIAAALMLAACQTTASLVDTTSTPTVIDPTPTPRWLQTSIHGITLGMWQPQGWETVMSDGLVIAEQTSNKTIDDGMLIYVFVPSIDQFNIATADPNLARAVLNQVVHMLLSHTGSDLVVSQPAGFTWGNYDAAYYLLTTGDGTQSVVLALALPGQQKVVVCHISSPADRSSQIRAMLPQLFTGLQIDGQTLPVVPLDELPDPLPFPRYNVTSTVSHQMNVRSGSP